MINRLKTEHERFILRDERIAVFSNKKPLVAEKIKHLEGEINRLGNRVKTIRELQNQILTTLDIVQNADFSIQQTTRQNPDGEEQTPPEIIALKKLAAFTGSPKVRRAHDGEIIRPERLDPHEYKGHPDRRPSLYLFSTAPRPGVYSLYLDGIAVDTDPVYISITEDKK